MAPRYVMHTTILPRGIVQTYPARKMSHRLRSGPIGIVLMPDHNSAMLRRLIEKLVMPEADRALQKLRRRHTKSGVPQKIVKARRDAPGSQRMEENFLGIGRFIGVKLIKQFITR